MMSQVLGLLLRAAVVSTATAVLTFILLWKAPGDPALAIALARHGTIVPADVVEQIRIEAGLNVGFWAAFQAWLGPLLVGDFGNSSVTGLPVWPSFVAAISYTIPLAFFALSLGLCTSIPLAIIASRNAGSFIDRFVVALASLGTAIPAFWLGLLLILLFAVNLGWLPAIGARTPAHAILPAVTLGLGVAASLTRIIRSGILEARAQPFLPALARRGVTARARGRDHIAPHAAVPVVTVLGLELAFLMEGLVIVEVIFSRPGLGSYLVNAITARDFPQVQIVVLFSALLFVTINLLIDLIYKVIDPRIGASDA